jgi:putative transposase
MKLTRSSFYYNPKGKDTECMQAEADLRDKIEAICLEFPRYGYRRVTHQLKHEGCQINHKKVLRLMRESDLLCRVKRKWVKTTDSRHLFPRYPNLIKGMAISRLNQVWISDITYIRIKTGFVYLAAILDAYSRRVIGYAVSASLDTSLTLKALMMAVAERQPGSGVIHHSDQGVQYASAEYVEELKSREFEISMARTGNPYENAMIESFFKTLKYEEVQLYEYETFDDVIARLPYFLEGVYNQKRLHSALGYRSPNDFERLLITAESNDLPRQPLLTLSVQPYGFSQVSLCTYFAYLPLILQLPQRCLDAFKTPLLAQGFHGLE